MNKNQKIIKLRFLYNYPSNCKHCLPQSRDKQALPSATAQSIINKPPYTVRRASKIPKTQSHNRFFTEKSTLFSNDNSVPAF